MRCHHCLGRVTSDVPALRCRYLDDCKRRDEPCYGACHLACFRGSPPGTYAESDTSKRKFKFGGNRPRETDARMLQGRWVCPSCVVGGTVGGSVHSSPNYRELLLLEEDRQLRLLAAYADSTRDGHITGENKILEFERHFGMDVLPPTRGPFLPGQVEIKVEWATLYGAQKMVMRGKGADRAPSHIKLAGLQCIRGAISARSGCNAMFDQTVPRVPQGGADVKSKDGGAELTRLFKTGMANYMDNRAARPYVLETPVVADIQVYGALGYCQAVKNGDLKRATQMAALCWYCGIMGMVGYRPNDVLFTSRAQWMGSKVEVDGVECHQIVLNARDMKGNHDTDHIVTVPGASASLALSRPGVWLVNCSLRLGVAATAPMVSGISRSFDSTMLLSTLLRPALETIRDGSYSSSPTIQDIDLERVNVRSFRRSATKAMRKAGVDPDLIRFIQQWRRRGNRDMLLHYDEIDARDTVSALNRV